MGILALTLFFYMLSKTDLPSFDELENPDFELATDIYAAKGELLGRYYIEKSRTNKNSMILIHI